MHIVLIYRIYLNIIGKILNYEEIILSLLCGILKYELT